MSDLIDLMYPKPSNILDKYGKNKSKLVRKNYPKKKIR